MRNVDLDTFSNHFGVSLTTLEQQDTMISKEKYPRGASVVCCKDGRMMIIGGEKPSSDLSDYEQTSGLSKRVVLSTNRCFLVSKFKDYATDASPMHYPRMYHSSEAVNDLIIVIGGVDGSLG